MKNIRIAKIMSRVASRLSAAALLAVLAGTLHADDWVYDNGTVSNGVWTFTAQLKSGTKVELTALTGGPSTLTALDFTKPIKDTSGNALSIGYFGRLMDAAAGQAFRPYVGELTLPASGYTGIGKNAFSWCVNATGTISLPGELTGMEGGEAFSGDSGITIVGNSFPSGLKEIYPSTFRKCKIQGDLELTYVEKINQFSFAETDVRAVTFGPALKEISNYSGDGAEGAFENCANLERVTFDPASSVSIYHGDTFCNCVSLTKLDLSPVVHIEQKADGVGHFRGCTSLKTVTFGSKLDYLDGRTFNGASALEMVVFKGPPPTTITNTYMYGLNRRVSTVVYLDPGATDYDYETAKAAWDDLTAGGEINYETSTWKSGYIGDVDASLRPLVLYSVSHVSIAAGTDADEGRGVVGSFTVSRGADDSLAGALVVNYTVGGTAVAGQTYGELSGSVTIPTGARTGTIEVAPLDDPATTSNTTVVVTLSDGDYEIIPGAGTATIQVVDGASFGGWKYAITEGASSGTMSKGGWSFAATHTGRNLTVGAVTAWPDEISDLDFSEAVVGSDGHAYTIVRLGSSDNGLGLAGTDPGNVPKPSEPGDRVGRLTMPGEGLTSICANAFACCTNAYGDISFPSSLVAVGGSAFRFTKISGDLTFPALETLQAATFEKTKITSATFGPALKSTNGAWERGPFAGCTSLTNVVFDPASKVDFQSQGYTFWNCSALTDLDLSCATNFAWGSGVGARFHGCTSLTNITFGAELTKLPANLFQEATALQSIRFKGAAPVIVGGSAENGGLFKDVSTSQTITTYVSVKYADVKNSANLSWKDYVHGDVLGKTATHWESTYLDSSAGDGTRFPLLRIDGSALIIYVR